MIVVIFESLPKKEMWDHYFDLAGQLRPQLSKMSGFISIERFESTADPKKILSLSFWRDEESVTQWRNGAQHRRAQKEGRKVLFENYRLIVANVIRDYGMYDRGDAPADSQNFHK